MLFVWWLLSMSRDVLYNQGSDEKKFVPDIYAPGFFFIIFNDIWGLCQFQKIWKKYFDVIYMRVYVELKKIFVKFAVRPLSREITMSQAYQNMCAGMYKVIYTCLLNNGFYFF